MAQNVTIAGNQYPSVPSILIPKTGGGGNATFTDTSPTTASASDVVQGKIFFDSTGTQQTGTASGGSAVIQALSVTQNGTYTAPTGVDGYSPVTVSVSGGGGGGGSLSEQVRFFDYDGTLVDSYSKADFNALSAMPSNPSHSGLTAQGWNWTLAQAKAYLTSYPDGILNIGQMYTTDDGKTRLYIHIDDDTPSNRLNFYVRFTSSVADNVSLDWGDGTVETKGSTSAKNYSHTYATGGDYVIKLTVNSGTISFVGSSGSSGNSIFGSRGTAYSYNRGRIRKAEIGDKVTSIGAYAFHSCYSLTSVTIPTTVTSIDNSAFYYCYSLTSITIPNDVTSIGNNAFYSCFSLTSITIPSSVTSVGTYVFNNCYSLTSITIPTTVTSIETYVFYYCYSLTRITIPSTVTSIGIYAFQYCYSLTRLEIPSSVTSIGASAFNGCYGIGEYHFESTTPPTITTANVFSGITSDCKIYVPYSADHSVLTAYRTANYWSNYASYMVEESA